LDLICEQSTLRGEVAIPGSKSHTIRAVAIAALAGGESRIEAPLESDDARAAITAYRALGADIDTTPDAWTVRGFGGEPTAPTDTIDVGNSGTTIRMVMGSCALLREGMAVLTGDAQIKRRPGGPLAQALTDLGARVRSVWSDGCAPFEVEGTLRGGETTIECVTSQYLSSLLLNAPLAEGDTTIHVPLLNEKPYVEMTLDWLTRQGIRYEREGWELFRVQGGQRYAPVNRRIPADFSSATFFLGAGALGDNDITLHSLDTSDTQGDRAVVDYVRQLGAQVQDDDEGIHVHAGQLTGCEIDLNATPDALPMMAVLGCFARGETRLVNVPQARLKETDRIAVMHQELERMGAKVRELDDGLVIEESELRGSDVDGHDDHRVVMSLAIAATQARGATTIHGCEAVAVTYPGFVDALTALGASVRAA
jgi:3-phosphoshikimate 1-carboxyvinyltransferase